MKKAFFLFPALLLVIAGYCQVNVSTGLGSIGSIDTWKVGTAIPATANTFIISHLSPWEAAPVAGTNAKWISPASGGNGTGMTDYFYEKQFSVTAGIKKLTCSFRVAGDDVIKTIELVRPDNTLLPLGYVNPGNYKFAAPLTDSFRCPAPGLWKLRIKVFCGDPKSLGGPTGLLVSGNIMLTEGQCDDNAPAVNACCPGKNLVCNGGFEEAKPCFESDYKQAHQNSLKPGEYSIASYQSAGSFCKQWSNLSQAPCQKTGKGMFVNGVTNGSGKKVIWRQSVNFNGWAQYRFCADIILLPQCCFNVVPKLEIKLTYKSGGQVKTVLLNQSSAGPCGINYSQTVAQWEGSDPNSAVLSISVDESGSGDGNDFILDNIALVELQPISKTITNSSAIQVDGNLNITGSFSGTLPGLPGEAGFGWYITPLDNSGQPDPNCPPVNNPAAWWTATTNFPGFTGCGISGNSPGKLLPGKSYLIYFGTFGKCYAWDAAVFKVSVNPASKKAIIEKKLINDLKNEPALNKLLLKAIPVSSTL